MCIGYGLNNGLENVCDEYEWTQKQSGKIICDQPSGKSTNNNFIYKKKLRIFLSIFSKFSIPLLVLKKSTQNAKYSLKVGIRYNVVSRAVGVATSTVL